MKRLLVFYLLTLFVVSCGSRKKSASTPTKRQVTVKASKRNTPASTSNNSRNNNKNPKADKIIKTALSYSGTRYKYGGTTKKGMDCSGLLYVSFGQHNVSLPRVSYNMAEKGKSVRLKNVEKGDLLFFSTRKSGRKINHVGMVVDVKGDDIKFIHSSSSRGVIVSSLREGYWNHAFIKANRVL